jgi:hypothetical protein
LAPGVRSISWRVTSVVGVAVFATAVSTEAVTVMAASADPFTSCTCATGAEPDATVTACATDVKSLWVTVNM